MGVFGSATSVLKLPFFPGPTLDHLDTPFFKVRLWLWVLRDGLSQPLMRPSIMPWQDGMQGMGDPIDAGFAGPGLAMALSAGQVTGSMRMSSLSSLPFGPTLDPLQD